MTGKPVHVGRINRAILDDKEDLSLWDEEELLRGQRRSRNGDFQGSKPKVVPKRIHDELVRRTLSKAHETLRSSLEDAVTLFATVVRDKNADLKLRLMAAKEIKDSVMGKAPINVDVYVQELKPFEQALLDAFGGRQPTMDEVAFDAEPIAGALEAELSTAANRDMDELDDETLRRHDAIDVGEVQQQPVDMKQQTARRRGVRRKKVWQRADGTVSES